MTGMFYPKYHVAVYAENNKPLVKRIAETLKSWFHNKIVVESYTDPQQMFIDFNVARAKNKAFDMTIIGADEDRAAKVVLKYADPSMEVIKYKDETTLKKDTGKLAYRIPSKLSSLVL